MTRRGSQTPRIVNVPPAALPTRAGDVRALWAAHGRLLDLWQRRVLNAWLRVNGAGRWAAYEAALVAPRQNGKNEIVEAVELTAIQRWGVKLVVHTAHEVDSAVVAFARMAAWEDVEGLEYPITRVSHSTGRQFVEFSNGAVIRYVARSKAKGRGWANAGLIVFDEAMMKLEPLMLDALLPTLAVSGNPQVIYLASGDLPESEHLRRLRRRALAKDPSLAWLEWSTPRPTDGRPLDLDSAALRYACNAALGVRFSNDWLDLQRKALGDEGFSREHLCVWSDLAGSGLVNEKEWIMLGDEGEFEFKGRRTAVCVDAAEDLSHITVAAAAMIDAETARVSVLATWTTAEWLRRELGPMVEALGPAGRGFFADGPVSALAPELRKSKLAPIKSADVAEVCGSFLELVESERLVHDNHPELTAQLLAARKQPRGDRWVFARDGDPVDAVYAAAGAVWLARQLPGEPTPRKVILPSGTG